VTIFKADRAVSKGFRGAVASMLLATTALGAGAIAVPSTAHAQARSYNIPAGPLAVALNRFGEAADVELVYDSALTNGVSSAGLKGSFGTAEALSRLLAGTGLTFRQNGPRSFTLERAPQSADGAIQLGPVRVEGEGARGSASGGFSGGEESASGPVFGYVARRSATGTKTDTPIIETPQSISVVTADQIARLKAQSLQEALGYTAGVAAGVGNSSSYFTADTMLLRGFEGVPEYGNFFRDGTRFMSSIFSGKQEPYGLERVEYLKGAASILYGASAPGGIINTVTKRPQFQSFGEVNVEYGSFERKQVSIDLTGPLDSGERTAFRFTALARDSETFVDQVDDDRIYIAPAFTWKPSGDTSITLLASYLHMNAGDQGALPATGSLLPNPNGQLPRGRNLGDPEFNRYTGDTYTIGYIFEHAFSDSVKLRQNLRYGRFDVDYNYVLGLGLDAAQINRTRLGWKFSDVSDVFTVDTNLQIGARTGALDHTILLGLDYSHDTYDSRRSLFLLTPQNIYDPTYGNAVQSKIRDEAPLRSNDRIGIYGQDQIKIADRWVIALGGRYEWLRFREEDRADTYSARQRDGAFTGRAGLIYLAPSGLAPFLSFSQSYELAAGRDRLGTQFKPTRGEQFEGGIRYQPEGRNLNLTATAYQLTRKNVLSPDPADNNFSVQTGEVRSRGVELEAKAEITADLSAIAAYTYTDSKITRSERPAEVGQRFIAPEHVASLFVDYRLSPLGLNGLSIGGGARYVSMRPAGAGGALATPAYTLFDAVVSYENGPWLLSVNAANLTDKSYFPRACQFFGCTYGTPRSVIGTLSYRW
jgi:iron complex outermembrane receptor protein